MSAASRSVASRSVAVVFAVTVALVLASCSSAPTREPSTASSGTRIAVVLTDSGCSAKQAEAPAGTVTFDITATGSGAVTEVELQRNGRILAEKENIAPGLSGSFGITLKPGAYELYCPGGSGGQTQPLTVTAADAAPSSSHTPAPTLTPTP